jgi:hypothetical protein
MLRADITAASAMRILIMCLMTFDVGLRYCMNSACSLNRSASIASLS